MKIEQDREGGEEEGAESFLERRPIWCIAEAWCPVRTEEEEGSFDVKITERKCFGRKNAKSTTLVLETLL